MANGTLSSQRPGGSCAAEGWGSRCSSLSVETVAFGCNEEERRSEVGIRGFSSLHFPFIFEFWFCLTRGFTVGAADAALVFDFVLCVFLFGPGFIVVVVGLPLLGVP